MPLTPAEAVAVEKPMDLQPILDRIQIRLKALSLSATAASKQAGVPDAIRNIERIVSGEKPPGSVTLATLSALAGRLETTIAWLLFGDDENANGEFVRLQDTKDALLAIAGRLDIDRNSVEVLVEAILQKIKDQRSPPFGVTRSSALRTFVHDKVDEFYQQRPDSSQQHS